MKIGKLITGFVLSTLLAVGVGVGISTSKNEVKNSKATDWVQNALIYFIPSDNWVKASASFKMKYYDNETEKGVITGTKMSDTFDGSRAVYKFAVTDDTYVSSIQLLRFSSDGNTQWNYSNKFDISNGNRYGVNTLVMDAEHTWWDTWTVGTTDENNKTIYWLNNSKYIKLAEECNTPSNSTTRVFIYNSDTHWSSSGKTAILAWGGSANVSLWDSITADSVYNLTWFQDDNETWYGYADIPTNVDGFCLMELTDDTSVGAYQVSSDYFSQNLWFGGDDGWENSIIYCPSSGNTVTKGGSHDDECGVSLMTKVLAAIDTCSSSGLNGYWTYSRINNYFYSHTDSTVQSTSVTTLNGVSKTIAEHIAGMASRAVSGNSNSSIFFINLNSTNSSTILIAIISSVVALAAVGGYFFLRRKKED